MTNEKKFKLVKEYPGSPEIGTIATHDYYYGFYKLNNAISLISKSAVEDYPEFWKPAYEIADGYAVDNETVYILTLSPHYSIEGNTIASLLYKYGKDNLYLNKKNVDKKIEELRKKVLERKDLKYYEDKVNYDLTILDNFRISQFKERFPKYYWLMILEKIAYDLNDNWKPNWYIGSDSKWHIVHRKNIYSIQNWYNTSYGLPVFKSDNLALEAIEIMGDKLDYIFK